jgi:hypothetical protein
LGAINEFVDFPLASVTVLGEVTCPCPVGETAHVRVAFGTGFPALSRTITVRRLLAGVAFWILITWPSPETTETVFWQKAAVASRLTPITMRASTLAKEDEVTGILLVLSDRVLGRDKHSKQTGTYRRETDIISLLHYGKKQKKGGELLAPLHQFVKPVLLLT